MNEPAHIQNLRWAGLPDVDGATVYHEGVRDCATVNVMRTPETGVLFLDSVHAASEPYPHRLPPAAAAQTDDVKRRETLLRPFVKGRRWVDVGCGTGGLLHALQDAAGTFVGVEPIAESRTQVPAPAVESIDELTPDYYDAITCIHVLEHVASPINFLKKLRACVRPSGCLFVEVPHGGDFLIHKSEAFRKHTFWSEHLILHTGVSLRLVLEAAGWRVGEFNMVQRYTLANHLGWILDGTRGGEERYPHLLDENLNRCYAAALRRDEATDTLWVMAVPK